MSNHVLYSETVTLSETGRFKKGSVGGDAHVRDPADGLSSQVGYKLPPRNGSLMLAALTDADRVNAAQCRVTLTGYNGRTLPAIKVPSRTIVELPCGVDIEGPPGTQLALSCWVVSGSGQDRGAASSAYRAGGDLVSLIPIWARSVDWSPGTSAVLTFRDDAAATVGVLSALTVGFSIPEGAVDCNLTGGPSTLVYRQN
jgi:hypothetical protein